MSEQNTLEKAYAELEEVRKNHSFDEQLQYIVDYCQECISDEKLVKYPDSIILDVKSGKVNFLYENDEGEFLKIVFHDAPGTDEIKIDLTMSKDKDLTVVTSITWNEVLKHIERW